MTKCLGDMIRKRILVHQHTEEQHSPNKGVCGGVAKQIHARGSSRGDILLHRPQSLRKCKRERKIKWRPARGQWPGKKGGGDRGKGGNRETEGGQAGNGARRRSKLLT